MMYSKTTDEILRELNELIVKARDLTANARKCEVQWYKEFWNGMADRTDAYADRLKVFLDQVANIAENPDEITNRFAIIKVMDDTAFIHNVMSLHGGVTIARARPEDKEAMWPLCEQYREFAYTSVVKAKKINTFLEELSALIFEDMRKTAAAKVSNLIQKGQTLVSAIDGYPYIRDEFAIMVAWLSSTPVEEITVRQLDDYRFMLSIISLAIDTDILRSGGRDEAMFAGFPAFTESLDEAIGFLSALPTAEKTSEPLVFNWAKFIGDVAYQSNILFFYVRGEVEKLSGARLGNGLLSDAQKTAFQELLDGFTETIRLTAQADDSSAIQPIIDRINNFHGGMSALADDLGAHGGSIEFITRELKALAGKVAEVAKAQPAANFSAV
jgi:hypothetical protein